MTLPTLSWQAFLPEPPNLNEVIKGPAGEEIDPNAVCPAASGTDRAQDCQGDETYHKSA
jgi:hypothetical protein